MYKTIYNTLTNICDMLSILVILKILNVYIFNIKTQYQNYSQKRRYELNILCILVYKYLRLYKSIDTNFTIYLLS